MPFYKEARDTILTASSPKPGEFPVLSVATYRTRSRSGALSYSVVILNSNNKPDIRFVTLYPPKENKKRGILIRGRDAQTGKFVPWTCYLKIA